jgi:PIN domain nuclease of toxin-antitoxin system
VLDTHTFLWFIGGNSRLTGKARQMIEDMDNERLLSAASLWEMAVKVSIGKLETDIPFEKVITEQVAMNAIHVLPIRALDVLTVSRLPFHHRDPFDRLIIAQAMTENAPIISIDTCFDSYPVKRLWK